MVNKLHFPNTICRGFRQLWVWKEQSITHQCTHIHELLRYFKRHARPDFLRTYYWWKNSADIWWFTSKRVLLSFTSPRQFNVVRFSMIAKFFNFPILNIWLSFLKLLARTWLFIPKWNKRYFICMKRSPLWRCLLRRRCHSAKGRGVQTGTPIFPRYFIYFELS